MQRAARIKRCPPTVWPTACRTLGTCARLWPIERRRGASMYAVIDTETTGLFPAQHDRIAEIAVVLLDESGRVDREWSTLINPGRDLGPQRIHGIAAKDIICAPSFDMVGGYLLDMLAGRVIVAHNLTFDLMFLRAEYERLEVAFPGSDATGLCTMRMASAMLPGAGRSLVECCRAAGLPLGGHHAALADARAAAALLHFYLRRAGSPPSWAPLVAAGRVCEWPRLPAATFVPYLRPDRGRERSHTTTYVGSLVAYLPRVEAHDPYLAVLDEALSDRYLSADESGALAALARSLDLGDDVVRRLHGDYLSALARMAFADGVLSEEELADLQSVADLLDLGQTAVDEALQRAGHAVSTRPTLARGDVVVLTGEMTMPRSAWEQRLRERGIEPHHSVTKLVRLVAAADADTLSGKAKKAHAYGIPVVGEMELERLLRQL